LKTTYDYIITGGGAAGLLLALRFAEEDYFINKSILIIEQSSKNQNDHTWCFWSKEETFIQDCVSKQWPSVQFKGIGFDKTEKTNPYTYNKVRSVDFYAFAQKQLGQAKNITWLQSTVDRIEQSTAVAKVYTSEWIFESKHIFNSIPFNKDYVADPTFPLINQHFVGWFVKTKQNIFNPSVATFMDFDIPQNGNTRFMYVLPTSENTALVEYTLFSKEVLDKETYEQAIQAYLGKIGVQEYEIEEKEAGCIPMTCYPFWQHNSENIHHIGVAGGWAKPSTGYTFRNSLVKTETIVSQLKSQTKINTKQKRQFWFYDLLLLDILHRTNDKGQLLFTEMFKHNSVTDIFRFLDEESSFWQNMKTIWSMPKAIFIQALLRRIFGRN